MTSQTSPPRGTSNLRIVLGPTNTGKTHLALARMLAYPSGMIGLPLRLLAREVYDRLLAGDFGQVHAADVALITGEEKIIPPKPRYYVCTVEAMPIGQTVDFLAVDEIQLATDLDRGHIFTDRILHARGDEETILLGAETMRPILQLLLPRAQIETRSRFSALRWGGPKKLSRLPRRTAVTAFSAQNVYAIAETIRQQKGGAAVVMGALSPRTRNAQVALYQAGEVDFLVATDAIGMGLNMDIDHVMFAQTRKFDGRQHRDLTAAELAQIAGRAGRHKNDGHFGVTGEVVGLDDETIARIENHEFDPVKQLMWRNPDLNFTSLDGLILSLDAPAPLAGLMKAPMSDDLSALTFLKRMPDILDHTQTEADVRRLWETAQIPDFRKTMASEHAALVGEIFLFLSQGNGLIPPDWLSRRIQQCDNCEGDLDTLSTRIAHIRTWNYVAHKSNWVDDPKHWQDQSRLVEDRLSDALHERLTRQFVDRKSSALLRRLQGREDVTATIDENGDMTIEGEFAGRLDGFIVQRDPRLKSAAIGAARRAVEQLANDEIRLRVQRILTADDESFALDHAGAIVWQGFNIAQLTFKRDERDGFNPLTPEVALRADDMLNGQSRQNVETRLQKWVRDLAQKRLAALARLDQREALDGPARGLAFQLMEAQGNLTRKEISVMLADIAQHSRAGLRKLGVRFGAYNVFVPDLLKPSAAQFNALSLSVSLGRDARADLHFLPRAGLTSAPRNPELPNSIYRAAGFHPFGTRVIRFDMLERLADLIRMQLSAPQEASSAHAPIDQKSAPPALAEAAPPKPLDDTKASNHFTITDGMLSIMGCSVEEMVQILSGLGYENNRHDEDARLYQWQWPQRPRKKTKPKGSKKGPSKGTKQGRKAPQRTKHDPDSPFAVLAQLTKPSLKKGKTS